MWWGEGVAREKVDHRSLPPNRCERQPVARAGSGPAYGSLLVTLVVPTRFWPIQNVPAHGPMLYEATNPFYYDF